MWGVGAIDHIDALSHLHVLRNLRDLFCDSVRNAGDTLGILAGNAQRNDARRGLARNGHLITIQALKTQFFSGTFALMAKSKFV